NQVNTAMTAAPSFQTFNYWSFGLTLSQYLWDFRAPWALGASRVSAEAQESGSRAIRQQVVLNARTAYFNARARRALALVARPNLDEQTGHLAQSRAFGEEGVRPEIDVAQAETNRANAELQLITAENAYQVAKVLLDQAMGIERVTGYDVGNDQLP